MQRKDAIGNAVKMPGRFSTCSRWLPLVSLILVHLPATIGLAADSPWLYGIHWYGTTSPGLVEEMTGGKGVCCVETVMLYSPVWGVQPQLSKFQDLTSRGHTLIIRLQPRWDLAVATEEDMPQYLADVTIAAQQLADLCHIWQIGNEVNLPGEYDLGGLTPANYISRFKRIRGAIKSVSSSLGDQIVLPSPVAPVDNVFLGAMLDHLTPSDFDGFALHAYGVGDVADSLIYFRHQYSTQLEFIDSRGYAGKPVYITEWGRDSGQTAENEAISAQFLQSGLSDLHAWNSTPGKHKVRGACWFVYANDASFLHWSILDLHFVNPPGKDNDLYDAFQYACTLSLPAGMAADFDHDGDVDQSDFGRFQTCLSGPNIPQYVLACADAMLDGDDDVDANDFGIFQGCMSAANVPADVTCAD